MSATPGAIVDDVRCRRCSYALRGLLRDSRCPECGIPIVHSFTWDNLYCCDPIWLRSVVRGSALLAACLLIASVAMAGSTLPLRQTVLPTLARALFLIADASLLAGTWLFTRPEPDRLPDARGARRVNLLRTALVCAPPLLILLDALPASTFATDAAFVFAEAARAAALAALIVCVVSLLHRIEALVERSSISPVASPEVRAKYTNRFAWAIAMPFVARLAIALTFRFAASSPPTRRGLAGFDNLFTLVSPLACLILSLAFIRAAVIFRRDARSAERNWSANRA